MVDYLQKVPVHPEPANEVEKVTSVVQGLKDLALTIAMASGWGIAAPVGAAGLSQLASAASHGYGNDDVDAVLKAVDPPRARR